MLQEVSRDVVDGEDALRSLASQVTADRRLHVREQYLGLRLVGRGQLLPGLDQGEEVVEGGLPGLLVSSLS